MQVGERVSSAMTITTSTSSARIRCRCPARAGAARRRHQQERGPAEGATATSTSASSPPCARRSSAAWRARTASGSPASMRWTTSTSRSSSTSTTTSSGASPVSTPHSATRGATDRREASRQTRAGPGREAEARDPRQVPRTISSAVPASRPRHRSRTAALRGAAAPWTPSDSEAGQATAADHVARCDAGEHEQVDAAAPPPAAGRASRRTACRACGGVAAERQQRLRPEPAARIRASQADDGLLGDRAPRPVRSAAPELELVDLEGVDERQGAAERRPARCSAGRSATARNSSSLPTNPAAGGTPATLSAPMTNRRRPGRRASAAVRNSSVLLRALTTVYRIAAAKPTGPPTPMATRT